jgi:hypothetical protein
VLFWLVGIAMIIVVAVVQSAAQEKYSIGGKITAAITESYEFTVGDAEGHIFLISKSEGMNTSTGQRNFMDGALIVNNNFGDLTKGNGPHEGYIIISKAGAKTIAKWEGDVTTTMSSGNVPMTTMEGTFTYIKGTGLFENIYGGGTYKGKYLSEKTYVVEWEGEYSIQK